MLTSLILPIAVSAVGTYLLIKLRAFFILHPIKTIRSVKGEITKDGLRSLFLALSGTLGVGNILGVAIGISVGGSGAVFWLLVSSLFSSVIKYTEASLSSHYKKDSSPGITALLDAAYRKHGKTAKTIYGISALMLSLTMGTTLQSCAIGDAFKSAFPNTKNFLLLLPLVLIVIAVVKNGGKKIKSAVGFIIPLTTIIYIIMCFCVIIPNIHLLPDIFRDILKNAFDFKSCVGGIMSSSAIYGIKEGFARGILSNEAGTGTSSFAHTSHSSKSSHLVGIFGIIEIFFDTTLLCTLTAITILIGQKEDHYAASCQKIAELFSFYIGDSASALLFLCIFAFAVSTVFCWYYYGIMCLDMLFSHLPKKSFKIISDIYFLCFILSVSLGIYSNTLFTVYLCDTIILFLSLITMPALIKKSDSAVALSRNFGLLK